MGLCSSSTSVNVNPNDNDGTKGSKRPMRDSRDHTPVLQVDGTVVNVPVFPVKKSGISLEGLKELLQNVSEDVSDI